MLRAPLTLSLAPRVARKSSAMPLSAEQIAAAATKRQAMAQKFEVTQRQMSSYVDDLALMRRSAVPYSSSWEGESISKAGPIPTDGHLIPSNMVIYRKKPAAYKAFNDGLTKPLHLSGQPWATYNKPDLPIYNKPSAPSDEAPAPAAPKSTFDADLFRAQSMEWTLQKNAFNPDIAAAMRTNVRKMAALSTVDPSTMQPDPARSSENVKAALSCSDVTGPAGPVKLKQLASHNVFPMLHSGP